MGYLFDHIPPGKGFAYCPDLYRFRILIDPGFFSDVELARFINDEIPDVEEWQFSGRRRSPIVSASGARPSLRQVHPATYAQDSRQMRPFVEKVWFAFHTAAQRAAVAARLDQERVKYKLVNEPV